MTIKGRCHCGAVGFELAETPESLTRCNCSYCRRAGALWAHADIGKVTVRHDAGATIRYIWGDKTLAFVTCRTCGCTTHWESLDPQGHPRMAVNCAMCDPKDIEGLPIRRFDGADTWRYLD